MRLITSGKEHEDELQTQKKTGNAELDRDTKPYQWFRMEVQLVFRDIFPIEDLQDIFSPRFCQFQLARDEAHSIEECKDRDTTYAAPLAENQTYK